MIQTYVSLRRMALPEPPPDPCDVTPFCPVCGGAMETVYERPLTKVHVCIDCHSGLTVPSTAWEIAKTKREFSDKVQPNVDQRH